MFRDNIELFYLLFLFFAEYYISISRQHNQNDRDSVIYFYHKELICSFSELFIRPTHLKLTLTYFFINSDRCDLFVFEYLIDFPESV